MFSPFRAIGTAASQQSAKQTEEPPHYLVLSFTLFSSFNAAMLLIVAFMCLLSQGVDGRVIGSQAPSLADVYSAHRLLLSEEPPLWAWVIATCLFIGVLVSIANCCRRNGCSRTDNNDDGDDDEACGNDNDGGGFFASIFGGDGGGGFFGDFGGGDCGGGGGDGGGGGGG